METTLEKQIEFKDLEFKPRKSQGLFDYKAVTCKQALVKFDNGYSLSILQADETGSNKYCQANKDSYEIAILKDDKMWYGYSDEDREGEGIEEDYELDQDNFEGVWIYQPQSKVEELLKVVQNFKKD